MIKTLVSLVLFVTIIGGIAVTIVATQQKTGTQSQAAVSPNMTLPGVIIGRTPNPPKQGWNYELTRMSLKVYVLPTGGINLGKYVGVPVKITGTMVTGSPSYFTVTKITRL